MKRTKILAMLLALLMCLSVVLTACNGGGGNGGGEQNGGEGGGEQNGQTATYTVKLRSVGGLAIEGATFYIIDTEDDDNIVAYGVTDKAGIGTASLPVKNGYKVEISNSLAGYDVSKSYAFSGNSVTISLASSVIADTNLGGVKYKVGDVMRDFTFTNVDGEKVTLSEVLKEKDGMLLNFFFPTCGPCGMEMPYMQASYEIFGDKMGVLVLCDGYPDQTKQMVEDFRDQYALTMDVAYHNDMNLALAFGVTSYPTSVFIDRYGVICMIEVGALTSQRPFDLAFEHFTAENYQQKLFTSIEELVPQEKPNVSMPPVADIKDALEADGADLDVTYRAEEKDEYAWPFIIGEDENGKYIYASNQMKESSYAILYADIAMKKDDVLAFDWYATTEAGADYLYVLVNGKDMYAIAGVSADFATRYCYVAEEDGIYEVAFCYMKDGSTDVTVKDNPYPDDSVCLRNLRIVSVDDIDNETYIYRSAATDRNENGVGFGNYVDVVFNEEDGYYHVGKKDGPLLLAILLDSTNASEEMLSLVGYDGRLKDANGNNIYPQIGGGVLQLEDYCNYALNGQIYGVCPVTEQLKSFLDIAAAELCFQEGANNSKRWLQFCCYYDAYGTDEQLADPIKGQADFSAFEAVESTDDELVYNEVYYDRMLMPRGFKYRFTPERSGVYRILSHNVPDEQSLDAWIFLAGSVLYNNYNPVDRFVDDEYLQNCHMYVYMEAGTDYYIDIAFYDIYATGGFDFTIEYLGESYTRFRYASPGVYSYIEGADGSMGETVALGIDVMLGSDGYYYERRPNGEQGSLIYADFTLSTVIFTSRSIQSMIEAGAFNFAYGEIDQIVLSTLTACGGDKDACRAALREEWGDAYPEYEATVEDVFAGKYHGLRDENGALVGDLTAEMRAYLATAYGDDAPEELRGCVAVDARLAQILWWLVDKYSFEGVENSWLKLCYYYQQIDADDCGGESMIQLS